MGAPLAIPLYQQRPAHPQAQVCAQCGVRQYALFGALAEAELARIHVHIADLQLAPGDSLFEIGQAADALYTVRAGVVRLERVNASGERRVVRLAGRGDLIGLEALLRQPYGAAALACTPVEVCRIPRGLVADLSGTHGAVTGQLMLSWQRALAEAEDWLAELSMGQARRRVLRLLLKLSDYAESPGPQPWVWLPSRGDMGAMLNMSMETASRLISALRREAVLLRLEPRRAQLDKAALMAALKSAEEK